MVDHHQLLFRKPVRLLCISSGGYGFLRGACAKSALVRHQHLLVTRCGKESRLRMACNGVKTTNRGWWWSTITTHRWWTTYPKNSQRRSTCLAEDKRTDHNTVKILKINNRKRP